MSASAGTLFMFHFYHMICEAEETRLARLKAPATVSMALGD